MFEGDRSFARTFHVFWWYVVVFALSVSCGSCEQSVVFSCATSNLRIAISHNAASLWGNMTIAHTNAGMASVGTFGVVSSDMEGSMISCYYGTELDGRSATCFDVDGSNYDIARSSVNYTVLLSALSNATHATMSFVAPASRFQHLSNSCLISYCWTPYDADAHLPHEHSSGADHGTVSVNFVSGIVMEEVNPYANRFTGYTIVLGIMLIALMIAVLCVRVGGFQPGPTRLATLRVAVPMLLLAMIFTVFEYAVKDFSLKIKPRFRALGEASAFILSLIMIPTTKHVGLGVILGSSYERMLFLHPFLGATLMFTMTVHMGGMFKTFETPTDLFQNTQNVYGFVAWIFMLCVALPAMTIRRQGYHVFRATHCLFVLVLLFAILHHTELVIMMIPAVLLWIVDIALRIRSAASANARIKRMRYDHTTRVLTLELSVKGVALIPCAAGSYIFLLVPSISPIMHPFSVALVSASGTADNATNRKDGTSGKMEENDCTTITLFVKCNAQDTFTGKLATIASSIATTSPAVSEHESHISRPSVFVFGPHGRLQVPIETCRHIVLVSGGIGVTPMLSILQYVGANISSLTKLQSITFLWVVRSHSVMNYFNDMIDDLAAKCAESTRISLLVQYFCTSREELLEVSGPSELQEIPTIPFSATAAEAGAPQEVQQSNVTTRINRGRPDVAQVLDAAIPTGEASVGCYICGPKQLQKIASHEAELRKYWVHCETFEL